MLYLATSSGPKVRDAMKRHPDWIAPDAKVVVIHGRHQMPSPVLTIDRVLKRDIVLSNGDRFSLTRLAPNGEHVRGQPTGDVWAPPSALFPADHPRVGRARREQDEREGLERIRSLTYTIHDAVRAGRWDEAHAAAVPLVELLAERTLFTEVRA